MELDEIMKIIEDVNLVSGTSISGGEHTLQHDIIELCKLIKSTGKFVSVDKNGTKPEVIKKLSTHIDKIALDLKAPLNRGRLYQITRNFINHYLICDTMKI